MCAQPMLAAPLHPLMSSSAVPFAARRPPCTQHWDNILNSYGPPAPHSSSSSSFASLSSKNSKERYDSYVNRWLAETNNQSRARSVPVTTEQEEQATTYNPQDHFRDHVTSSASRYTQPSQHSNAPAYQRYPHSASPDSGMKTTDRQNGVASLQDASIAEYLQIPSSINNSQGSLAELASQITCLFWFEDASTLSRVENTSSPQPTGSLPQEANPTIGFRKWVTTLLSTTQVSQNVILLALLFIYRLKKITANVKGKAGSEYRLLTVALMLGNKFLDDNTYTNKTWADVSGISVSEIHVMEVEFLSNMKYNLYTSKEQWSQWHVLLSKFADYFDKALRVYPAMPTPMSIASSHLNGHPVLPFTPPSEQLSPPQAISQHTGAPQRQLPTPLPVYSMATGGPQPTARFTEDLRATSLRAAGSRSESRKRSFDEPMFVLPHKHARFDTQFNGSSVSYPLPPSPQQHNLPRLPVPASSMPSISATPLYAPSYTTTVPTSTSQMTLPTPVALPQDQLWQSGPVPTPGSLPPGGPSLASLLNQASQSMHSFPTPLSMQAIPQPGSQNVSPTNTNYPTPQNAHSPSGYLMYRNSPYRPVRQVNTLLAPPPAMATLQSPSQHMSQHPTYYQPLSKAPIEPRQGMVPYLTPRQFQMAPMDPSRQMPPLEWRQY